MLTILATSLLLLSACGASFDRGGRLYDKWYAGTDFHPDKSATAALDGRGGPNKNGTLNGGQGKPLSNRAGHSYRLKNFWGWDLLGAAGIYGPRYQNKANVRAENLLSDHRSSAELTVLLRDGGPGLPAWDGALTEAELSLLVSFVHAMRRGMIPRATDIWTLSTQAPKSYVLNPGGDAARGQRHYKQSCGGCHGGDGTRIKIDKVYSLGAFGRSKAYEAWFKIMVGHPGSVMKAQPPQGSSRKESAAFILDVLAGLCDRGRFPALRGGKDVGDGDLRCGGYLK